MAVERRILVGARHYRGMKYPGERGSEHLALSPGPEKEETCLMR